MQRPEALPDELAGGYRGRFFRRNGWSRESDAMNALLSWAGHDGASLCNVPTAELLARAAGLDTTRFVQEHTLVPLRRAIVQRGHDQPHGSRTMLWTLALRLTRPAFYFCKDCVEEDYGFHGTPYWRRTHQMPGLHWCLKHHAPLSLTRDQAALLRSPSDYLDNSDAVDPQWVSELIQSDLIQRYLAICLDLLDRSEPLDERLVSKALRGPAAANGFHAGVGAVTRTLLSDEVRRLVDHAWLDEVVPEITRQPERTHWPQLDGATDGRRSGVSVYAYALTMAVLFETAEQAMDAIAGVPEVAPQARRTEQSAHLDEAAVRAAYVASSGRYKVAATSLNFSYPKARRRFRGYGLANLASYDLCRVRAALALLLDGNTSVAEAAQTQGMQPSHLIAILGEAMEPLQRAMEDIAPLSRKRVVRALRRPILPLGKGRREASGGEAAISPPPLSTAL
jgi:hypothetical protein